MMRHDAELAAALFSLLGEPVPHDPGREAEASACRERAGSDADALRTVLDLCSEPHTPQEYYLCEKACSWLGGEYRRQLIRYAEQYLDTAGWKALPADIIEDRGLRIDPADRSRAGVLSELAGALSGECRYEEAESRYMQAFRLEPHNAAHAASAAVMLVRLGKEREARDFLLHQKKNFYYRPVAYKDLSGEKKVNRDFRSTIDLTLAKLFSEDRNS